jgi:hypothetical protein
MERFLSIISYSLQYGSGTLSNFGQNTQLCYPNCQNRRFELSEHSVVLSKLSKSSFRFVRSQNNQPLSRGTQNRLPCFVIIMPSRAVPAVIPVPVIIIIVFMIYGSTAVLIRCTVQVLFVLYFSKRPSLQK